jgi:hypothetical protein
MTPGRQPLGIAGVLAILATPAMGRGALPDPAKDARRAQPAVTRDTIGSTICVPGRTRTVRPPRQFRSALKRQQMHAWDYADRRMGDFEEDHLIPLDLGGAPNADLKDELEAVLARLVCSGRLPLADAQRAIATNWVAAYRQYVAAGE